jgi:putative thioredoxin
MGTMYDVEYLLRTLLGYTLKSYLRNNQTADMGYLGARPVELHLGKSLRYLGTVTSLRIEHVIFNEQMVPLFEQAYPEAQVKMVIDKVLTLSSEQGVGQAPVEQMEAEEIEALEALEAGNYVAAEVAYKKWLSRKPSDNLAKIGLAQTQLLIRTEELELDTVISESTKNPSDIALQLKAADVEIVNGGVDAAFTRLLHAIRATSGDDRAKVKDHLLNLFALVDPSDPRLVAARKELASALF